MADRWGRFNWPGIVSPRLLTYTMSHGVQAGQATIRCNPQVGQFAMFGDLTIYDGADEPVVLRGCKVNRVEETRGPDGIEWQITIFDGRWRWRETGWVSAYANQLDPHGKFIPWTIRSPIELAELCLKQMGVTRFKIDLPKGLTSADGRNIKDFLATGVNFPVSGVNPPVDWFYEKPHTVLEQLADTFGCRVVPRWREDEVWIVQKGNGDDLPPGSISSQTPAVNQSETPDGCMVVGAPTRFQTRLALQAVGEDWDGILRPINDLSYAPQGGSGVKHKVTITGTYKAHYQYYAIVNGFQVGGGYQTGEVTMAQIVSAIASGISGSNDPNVSGVISASASGDVLTLEATRVGVAFDVGTALLYDSAQPTRVPNPQWKATIVQNAKAGGADWSRSFPPLFPGVRATDRLTLSAARELARKTVWKYYQLTGGDVADEKKPINIPGYGTLKMRQQLTLLDTQCAQVVPAAPDFNIRMRDGTPWIQNQYNGYSRDVPAACYGSILSTLSAHVWNLQSSKNGLNTADPPKKLGGGVNLTVGAVAYSLFPDAWKVSKADIGKQITIAASFPKWGGGTFTITDTTTDGAWLVAPTTGVAPGTNGGVWDWNPALPIPKYDKWPQVQVDFSIDSVYQCIKFSGPVYKWGPGGTILEPKLILQTAVQVRDPDTNAYVAYTDTQLFPGATNKQRPMLAVEKHEDVQLNVIPTYNDSNVVTSVKRLEDDPINRARYYLEGMIARLQVTGSACQCYNGIVPAQLDGAISQITWEVGMPGASGGAKTTISKNFEHNTNQLPFGARRRAEALQSAVAPGGFLGQLVGSRQTPTQPTPYGLPTNK